MNSSVQIQHSCDVLRVHDAKLEDVVKPVLAQPVPVLCGDGESIVLAAQQAIQLEFYFQLLAGFKSPKMDLLQPGVGAKDIHSDAVPDQNTNHWIIHRLLKDSTDPNHDALSRMKRGA